MLPLLHIHTSVPAPAVTFFLKNLTILNPHEVRQNLTVFLFCIRVHARYLEHFFVFLNDLLYNLLGTSYAGVSTEFCGIDYH